MALAKPGIKTLPGSRTTRVARFKFPYASAFLGRLGVLGERAQVSWI
jgi:hypothetical protein